MCKHKEIGNRKNGTWELTMPDETFCNFVTLKYVDPSFWTSKNSSIHSQIAKSTVRIQVTLPDRPFSKFRASRSENQQDLSTKFMSCEEFRSMKIVGGYVGITTRSSVEIKALAFETKSLGFEPR